MINVTESGGASPESPDNTAAIQSAFDAAAPAETVLIPAGTFLVDAEKGLRPKAGTLIQIDGVLKAIPNANTNYRILSVEQENVIIQLNGAIIGERHEHKGTAGEWGMGIWIEAPATIVQGPGKICDCWGDGIYITGPNTAKTWIKEVSSIGNRRQGMSVIQCNGLYVHGAHFLGTGGTAPGAGIDFEPDRPGEQKIQNVVVTRTEFAGNAGAALLFVVPKGARSNIQVFDNLIKQKQPIDGSDGIVPFWAKWFYQATRSYALYPQELHIP